MFRQKPASWQDQAENFRIEAGTLPFGAEREALERKARQLELACHLDQWISSPGLQPPR
jgi:hypothetical protein